MVPPSRLAALARYAATAWAATIARMPDTRRRATLLAFARVAEAAAHDAVLTVLDQLLGALLSRVMRQGERARLRTLRDLDAAALRLREACQVLLDYGYRDPAVREAAFARVAAEDLAEAVAVVAALTRAPDDRYYTELLSRYSLVRQFLPTLLKTSTFGGTPTGQPLLDALAFLRLIEGQATPASQRCTPGGRHARLAGARPRRPRVDRPPGLHLLCPGTTARGAASPRRLRGPACPLG